MAKQTEWMHLYKYLLFPLLFRYNISIYIYTKHKINKIKSCLKKFILIEDHVIEYVYRLF